MRDLPINSVLNQIVDTVSGSACCVLQADPGAGKSTAVPLAILQSDWFNQPQNAGKKIVMLEPRRLAVRSIANYLAKQLGEKVGQQVGYQVRNDKVSSKATRLEIVTEGILTRRLQSDPELSDTALVMFDEFHERSIHADLSLSLCLDVQAALRDDLKLLVMSATIDTLAVSAFLNDAPVIQSQGRAYPVETVYLNQSIATSAKFKWDILPILTSAILKAVENTQQDTLVFLPGQGEIKQTLQALQAVLPNHSWALLPLYGGLKPEQQDLAIQPDAQGRRKIILTTNIAETSLTIEGVDCVVDSGLARLALYDVNSGMTRLQTQRISKASAEQRKGRAGRLQAGWCYRLWSEAQQAQLRDYDAEEMTVTDLTSLCLELALWGVQSPEALRWLTMPPQGHFEQAQQLLKRLDLLTDKGHISELGKHAIQLGATPRLARLLLSVKSSNNPQLMRLACDVAALLSERDVLQNGYEVGADLAIRVLAIQAYRANRKTAQTHYSIFIPAMEQALQNSSNWQKQLGVRGESTNGSDTSLDDLGKLVAWAFPDRLAIKRSANQSRYLMANGKSALLHENDALNTEPCLVIANIDGQVKEGRVFLATAYSEQTLQTQFKSHIQNHAVYQFDEHRQEVVGSQQVKYEALILSEKRLEKPDESALHDCMLKTLKSKRLSLLPWNETNLAWLERVRWLKFQSQAQTQTQAQIQEKSAGLPDLTEAALIEHLSDWLAPYLSGVQTIKALKNLDLLMILQAQVPYELQAEISQQAPEFYLTPSGKKVKIRYAVGQNPTVSVQLQELFGELASPKLAWNSVPLTFELLSPARRPIQITADLANFWQTSYFEIAKEMRGRYPRHRWPEEPLKEKAGRSIKPRV
ncbi:MAG: ATP-dependent helicase HrpB [Thiotrichales bacterium]|nr:ATP-dependent helicase HrpB [Thiotrichales bacterium]